MTNRKEELKDLLLKGSKVRVKELIGHVHPADILDLIHEDEENAKNILQNLPSDMIADILEEAETEEQYELLQLFVDDHQKAILEEMGNDEITDLIGELDPEEQKELLDKVGLEDREEIQTLLEYDPESAGGIMSTEYIDIFAKNTVRKTIEFLQTNVSEDASYYLYVVDKNNVLKGVVSLRDIVTSPDETPMLSITNTNVKKILYSEDQEAVANKFVKYGYILMPVVDEEDHLLGVINFDDVMDVLEEETTEDIHLMGGINSEERIHSTFLESYKSRAPWLMINLFTASLAACVVNYFEGTIEQVVMLATVMPIVTALGGSAGTQSLTIVVRALSLGEITKENAFKVCTKEIGVGVVAGITVGCIATIGGYLFADNIYFGIVTGMAMINNMMIATIAGFCVPMILKRCNVDPALASGIFVTMVTDILGFLFFLGFATMFLPKLM